MTIFRNYDPTIITWPAILVAVALVAVLGVVAGLLAAHLRLSREREAWLSALVAHLSGTPLAAEGRHQRPEQDDGRHHRVDHLAGPVGMTWPAAVPQVRVKPTPLVQTGTGWGPWTDAPARDTERTG